MAAHNSRHANYSICVSINMNIAGLADVQMGYPFRSRLEHDPLGEVVVVQMKDIDDSYLLRPEGMFRVVLPEGKDHHLLQPGDLLFHSRGRSNGAALTPEGTGPAVLAAPLLRLRPNLHKVLPEYLRWFINAPETQAQLAALSAGTSVRMISAEALKTLEVPLPARARQQAIAQAAALAQQEQSLVAQAARLREHLTAHLLMKSAHEVTP